MLGELQKEKYRKVFRIFDADGNGFLELNDWVQIAERHAKLDGIGLDTPEYQNMRALFTTIWEVLRAYADTDRDQRVSLDEFLIYVEKAYGGVEAIEFSKLPDRERALFEVILKWVDRDRDGKISLDDYTTWLSSWRGQDVGVGAKTAFQRLDRDGDGYVSLEETKQYIAEFVLSNDPEATGNWIFG